MTDQTWCQLRERIIYEIDKAALVLWIWILAYEYHFRSQTAIWHRKLSKLGRIVLVPKFLVWNIIFSRTISQSLRSFCFRSRQKAWTVFLFTDHRWHFRSERRQQRRERERERCCFYILFCVSVFKNVSTDHSKENTYISTYMQACCGVPCL